MTTIRRQQIIMMVLLVAVWALLPFGRLSEIPVLILAVTGIVVALRHRVILSKQPWFIGLTILSGLYFLLTLISALDSYWPQKSFTVSFASWRFYFMGVAVLWLSTVKQIRNDNSAYSVKEISVLISKIKAIMALFWCVDAIIQALVGYDLFARQSYPGRLTGIFGDNVKLGPVLALMLPMVLIWGQQRGRWLRWLAFALMMVAILLSGTRSAWIMMAFIWLLFGWPWIMMTFIWLLFGWQQLPKKRWQTIVKACLFTITMIVLLVMVAPEFKNRIDRSAELFTGQDSALDYALADRIPIWHSAWEMYKKHPINGVGARAFRKAYPSFAADDDPWIAQDGVSLQAHHWVLELMAETGTLGFIFGLALIFIYISVVRNQFKQATVWPYATALMAAFLPVVSLYSMFSSFWSICLWWLVIVSLMGASDDKN